MQLKPIETFTLMVDALMFLFVVLTVCKSYLVKNAQLIQSYSKPTIGISLEVSTNGIF